MTARRGLARKSRAGDPPGDDPLESPWRGRPRASDRTFDERRLTILKTTARLFWQQGYHDTSLDEVCKILEITRPTLYYYAYSKQDCLTDICALAQEDIIQAIRRAGNMNGTGLARLQFLIRRYVEVLTTDFGKCLVLVGIRNLEGKYIEALNQRVAAGNKDFQALFDAAIADGSINVVNRRVAYEALIGGLNWIARWWRPDGSISKRELADYHVALMTSMLGGKASDL